MAFILQGIGAYDIVKRLNIGLEICLSSNIQTKAVDKFDQPPLKDFCDDALPITINTDNRTVSNTTMKNEVPYSDGGIQPEL
ncbi:MAG: hypothetical protein V5788_07270 [Shewanella sp.]